MGRIQEKSIKHRSRKAWKHTCQEVPGRRRSWAVLGAPWRLRCKSERNRVTLGNEGGNAIEWDVSEQITDALRRQEINFSDWVKVGLIRALLELRVLEIAVG